MESFLSFFRVRESADVGIFEVAMGTTSASSVDSRRAGTKPVHPASYTPMAGLGNLSWAIHAFISAYGLPRKVRTCISPVSSTRAQMVVVLEWLSIPNAVPMPAVLMLVLSIGTSRSGLLWQQ